MTSDEVMSTSLAFEDGGGREAHLSIKYREILKISVPRLIMQKKHRILKIFVRANLGAHFSEDVLNDEFGQLLDVHSCGFVPILN